MVARKNQFNQQLSAPAITMERSRLIQAKTLAARRQDYGEVADIDAKLKELPVIQITREEEAESLADKLAKVNERNRKANLEAVRKAELLEIERKRRERKLANAGASGVTTPSDPSARLKTIPRTFNDTSRLVLYPVVRGLDFMILFVTRRTHSPCAEQVWNAKREWNTRHYTTTGTKPATYIPTANISPRGLATLATERQVSRSLSDRKHRSRPRGFLIRDLCIGGDWLFLSLVLFLLTTIYVPTHSVFVISDLIALLMYSKRGRLHG